MGRPKTDGRFQPGHKPVRSERSGKIEGPNGLEYPEGFAVRLNPEETSSTQSFRLTTSQRLRLEELADNAHMTTAAYLRNLIDAVHKAKHTSSTGTAQ